MKAHHILIFFTAAALADLALAEQPAVSAPAVNAPALGTVEATLDFCEHADPKGTVQYRQRSQLLLQGVSADAAAEIRNSDEYRQAYDSTAEMIGNLPRQDAIRACADSLAANR